MLSLFSFTNQNPNLDKRDRAWIRNMFPFTYEHQTAGGVLTDRRRKRHKGTRHVAARTELFQCARIRTLGGSLICFHMKFGSLARRKRFTNSGSEQEFVETQ